MIINETLIEKFVYIHNGKEYIKVYIDKPKIGFKFGEFIKTRKKVEQKKIKKKK